MPSARLYVGNLDDRCDQRDIDKLFYKFGRIRDIVLKRPPRGAPFAFVEFEDSRDAEDAVYELNGVRLLGERIRVEHSKAAPMRGPVGGGGPGGGRSRSEFRLLVRDMPKETSWQDLKDFIRHATNNITFADVRDGVGYVELRGRDDIRAVMDKLDGTDMENRFRTRSRVTIDVEGGGSRSRSRSPRGGRRSRSRSRSRSRGRRSRSPSRSRSRDRGRRSGGRSRSRSRDRRSRSRSRSRSASADKGKAKASSRSASRSRSRGGSRSRSRSRSGSRAKEDAKKTDDAASGDADAAKAE